MTYLGFASGVLKFVYILFFWALLNKSVKVWTWFVGVFQGFTLLEAMLLVYSSRTLTRWSLGEAGRVVEDSCWMRLKWLSDSELLSGRVSCHNRVPPTLTLASWVTKHPHACPALVIVIHHEVT